MNFLSPYQDHKELEEIRAFAQTFLDKGHRDESYILKRVRKRFGEPPPELPMRTEPSPLVEAIDATEPEEIENLAKARRKITELLHSPVVSAGALMPDACIAGTETASLPVGGVVAAGGAIIPSAHSADICCSVFATFYEGDRSTSDELDVLMQATRFGPGGRSAEEWVDHPVLHEEVWENPFLSGLQTKAQMHLADQGDGNHFASLGELNISAADRERLVLAGHHELSQHLAPGRRAIVTHHGSRGLGAAVFKRGLAAAIKHTHALNPKVPEAACWLDADSDIGQAYWEALAYVRRWTLANHQVIHERFLDAIDSAATAFLGNEHNFVWRRGETYLHGKGATPAWPDEEGRARLGLIPLNMCEPILLVLGSDRQDVLSFAPHGAGRNLSRSAWMRSLRREKSARDPRHFDRLLAQGTTGTEIRWYSGKPDLTETALAYKPADTIREQIAKYQLAEIIAEITPRGCIMAGQSKSWKELRAEHLTPKQKRQLEHRRDRRRQRQNEAWE